ncbi:transposase [Granulosicoccus antarcticus]|uniref:Transposase IS3/IS911 family protein n=1 Tax=Granulosicoccus antarcticus IMCC3135 TaxID=1192854 RepID=A0A2Z2NNJ9_9GAMM|nr:transposase [Granulosicoccus antarcticus]ASJ72803.1 hypothetical protein IMCC3135_13590 [Granulosicoccus antarcticus IMCC3135]
MKKKQHSDEQILKILREANETTAAATPRSHSITEQIVYRWQRLYDGMQVNDVKEFKALRDEYQPLKKLLAERDLEVDVMKEINTKKW